MRVSTSCKLLHHGKDSSILPGYKMIDMQLAALQWADMAMSAHCTWQESEKCCADAFACLLLDKWTWTVPNNSTISDLSA